MLNRYPLWKYLLLVFLIIICMIYAAPNLFREDPAVQISGKNVTQVDNDLLKRVETLLHDQNIPYKSTEIIKDSLLIRFTNGDDQIKARDVIKATLGDNYIVALNLSRQIPAWLEAFGAQPMKLGLDLQGGVNFLLDVDMAGLISARQEGDMSNMSNALREANVRYLGIFKQPPHSLIIRFGNKELLDKANQTLSADFKDYTFATMDQNNDYRLVATLTPIALVNMQNYAVEQNMAIFRNRVNELGVSEAIVTRQGEHQISIDLPGIQDTARAKDLLGKTATLKFQLVDMENDASLAQQNGATPFGDRLYEYESAPILLKNQVILRGDAITYATAIMGQDGRPAVQVRLGGGGEGLFNRATAENIGKLMAVVYVESASQTNMVNGQPVITRQQVEKIISVATIQSALGNSFEITGLSSSKYAQDLALMLRSGALVAPVDFVSERTVGPTLGAANIEKGINSLVVGSLLVFIFMILYYRLFGFIADLALILNLIFIVAVLSLLGATLTLAGMAAIVLTVGIAVDANVLIYERIREELRNGVSPQASIQAGYERAFATIVDANVTSLIVALVLFALGSGTVKSFAITLIIGILTSMVSAVFFTRAIVNLIYGGRTVKWLSIGIRPRAKPQPQLFNQNKQV